MKDRLPIVIATTALVVSVLGVTPVGDAAGNAVRRALFAVNAGKVNGIRASKTPKAKRLLALGSDAKFPVGVQASGTIAARARGASSVVTPEGGASVDYPLSANTWTQLADEDDLFFGAATFTPPAACTLTTGGFTIPVPAFLTLQLLLDGAPFGLATVTASGTASQTRQLSTFIASFAPGSTTGRTLTLKVSDGCSDPGQSFTMTGVAIDVLRVR